jgi:[ribosomal protein S18]-alanine N-acetyltransferase
MAGTGRSPSVEKLRDPVRSSPRITRCIPLEWPVAFTVRDFENADFDTLWRIDQTCFPAGISYTRAELSFYMRRPTAFTLVAVNHGNENPGKAAPDAAHTKSPTPGSPPSPITNAIAGFIVAEAGPRAQGHIITIDVAAAARRFGVGSLLLAATEDRLRAARCRVVELETAVDNVSALSFYKRHRYSVTKTHPRYYPNGLDALVLEKNLL